MTRLHERHRPAAAQDSVVAEPRPADDGPAVDPASPFAEDEARRNRRAARQGRVRGRIRTLFSWLFALAVIVGAVYAGIWLTGHRLAGASRLPLGTAMLTARTVGVPAPGDAQVVDIRVHPSQAVTKGSPLAVLKTFGTNSTGTVKTSRLTIKAPVSGVVSSLPSPVGSAVKRGDAIVQMYNPRRKSFEVPVDTSAVSRLRRGMHVKLTSPAISGWIPAVVDHVVAPIAGGSSEGGDGTTSTPSDGLTVVLRPRRADYVSGLTPGLQFSAVVDTDSAPARAPEVVRVVGS